MRIVCILSTYNEAQYLPLKIKWALNNRIDLYVCDNMSTDGTWEILQANGIPSHRYDTGGMFSEILMQEEIRRAMLDLAPDWVIYNGCDLFPVITGGLKKAIYRAESIGSNIIRLPFRSAKYTGEERKYPFNPFDNFRMVQDDGYLDFIFKFHIGIKFHGDQIEFPYLMNIFLPEGLMINYGDTKEPEKRIESLKRRQLAWDRGENAGWGEHLRHGERLNWLWDRELLTDIHRSKFAHLIKKLERDSV